MSTLKGRQALEQMSPLTREVLDRLNLLHQQDWPFEQKADVQSRMMAMLTPEQRAVVEREALRAAIDLQHSNPAQGNRAARRKARLVRARRGSK